MASAEKIRIEHYLTNNRGIWMVSMRVFNDPNRPKPYTLTRSTGYKVKEKTPRKERREIEEKANEIVERVRADIESRTPETDVTVVDYVEKWLTQQVGYVRENTLLSYRQYANRHVIPFFKDVKLSELTTKKVQEYIDLKCQTLKVDSVRKHMVVINGVVNTAAADELQVKYNEKGLRFPKKNGEKFVGKTYTVEQVRQLLEAAAQEGGIIQTAVVADLTFGLRRSELCGLRWSDVDFDKRVIHVRNTVVENGSLILEEEITKTKNSNRILYMDDNIYNYLLELKAHHDELGLKRGKIVAWENDRRVRPSYVTRKLSALQKKYGLEKIRLHDLRHTAASLLLSNGSTIYEVSKFLGHEDISTTSNIYGHLVDEQKIKIANTMGEVLSGANENNV